VVLILQVPWPGRPVSSRAGCHRPAARFPGAGPGYPRQQLL